MNDAPPPPEFQSGSSTAGEPTPSASEGFIPPAGTTGWARLGSGEVVELAGIGARFGARVIDTIVLLVLIFVLSFVGVGAIVGAANSDGPGFAFGAIIVTAVLLTLVGVAYEVSFIALRGQTPGKMVTNVKVVRADNGQIVGWGKSIARWIIPLLLNVVPFIGWLFALLVYVSAIWDKTRQGWHDKASGTLVIKAS